MVRILLISLINLFFVTEALADAIGTIEELTGPAQVEKHSGGSIDIQKGSGVESLDTVVTANARANIVFVDDTQVAVTENSKLLIDEYVFDPATSKGKLSLKIAEGTVRYASGIIAHTDNTQVDIETPTATIGVRGTDFTMTVDEQGRSLIVLLPDANGKVGKIEVSTAMGTVLLDKAFQATYTEVFEKPPTPPVILALNESQINNMLILNRPEEVEILINPLDEDLLKIDDLNVDVLDVSTKKLWKFTELDVNELDVDLLSDVLSVLEDDMDGKIEGFNSKTGIYTFKEENAIRIVRSSNNTTDFRFDKTVNQHIYLSQDTNQQSTIDTIDKYSEGNMIIIIQR